MRNHKKAKQILDGLGYAERDGLLLFLSEIALQRPSAIINAAESLEKRGADLKFEKEKILDEKLIELIRGNRFIDAVKLHRHETGFGLRESKDHCDRLRETIRFS